MRQLIHLLWIYVLLFKTWLKTKALISQIVSEGEIHMNEGKDKEAGYKLLQALRGMPKHPKVMKIFQEGGTKISPPG